MAAFHALSPLGQRAPTPEFIASFAHLVAYLPFALIHGLLGNTLLLVFFWVGSWAIGAGALARLRFPATKTESALIYAAVGSGVTSLLLLFIGLAHFWSPAILRGIFVVLALSGGGLAFFARRGQDVSPSEEKTPRVMPPQSRWGMFEWSAMTLIICAFTMNALASNAPETFYDSLVYHLALPKLHLLSGGISSTPQNLYSGFPSGLETLYALALSVSNESLAILFHGAFGWLSAYTLWILARRRFPSEASMCAVLAFALSPVVLSSGWQSGADLGTVFYFSVALLTAAKSDEVSDAPLTWCAVSGILLGFACGTKYTAMPLAGLFIAAYIYIHRKSATHRRGAFYMALTAAASAAPWLIRNAMLFHDPVYPFAGGIFHGPTPDGWGMFLSDAHATDIAELFSTHGLKSVAALPWTTATNQYVDYRLSISYLLLAPCVAIAFWDEWCSSSDNKDITFAAITLLLALLLWLLTSTITRFLMPALLLVSLLAAAGYARLSVRGQAQKIISIALLWIGLCNISAIFYDGLDSASLFGKWPSVTGHRSRDIFLQSEHAGYGQPYYDAMRFINETLPSDAVIAFIGEPRAYYCERRFVAASVFDRNPFWDAVDSAHDSEEIFARLKSRGITHVFVNAFQLYSNAQYPSVLPRGVAASPIFTQFLARHLNKIYEKKTADTAGHISDWLTVYEMTPERRDDKFSPAENPILAAISMLTGSNSAFR